MELPELTHVCLCSSFSRMRWVRYWREIQAARVYLPAVRAILAMLYGRESHPHDKPRYKFGRIGLPTRPVAPPVFCGNIRG